MNGCLDKTTKSTSQYMNKETIQYKRPLYVVAGRKRVSQEAGAQSLIF